MNIRNILIKTAGVFSAVLSIFGIYILFYLNGRNFIFAVNAAVCIAGAFIFINFLKNYFSEKTKNIIFITSSVIILLLKIITTPYSPCHDSLDLHNLLNYMFYNNNSMAEGWYIKAYMNVFVNNKLVVYIYLPFVYLFKNVMAGTRFLNGILFIASVYFTASSVNRFLKINCFGSVFFMISIIAPSMLLSGPYIYLPAIFISAVTIFCYGMENKIFKILFLLFTAILFILRLTCFGFVIAFIILDAIFGFKEKKELIKKITVIILAVIFSFAFKNVFGAVMYKTGLHIYPNMLNGSAIWEMELGTRTNGEATGTCFYTMFEPSKEIKNNADDIQNDFFTLWNYYWNDTEYGTYNYDNIVNLQNSIRRKIIKRTICRSPSEIFNHLRLKSITFFKDSYIPYYYKENLNNKNININKNYDKKYFAYMNMIFLLFFLSVIINTVKIFKGKADIKAVSSAVSAIAVNLLFLLVLEVQKKYMFDFFIPMVMCIVMTFSFDTVKNIKKTAAAVISAIIAAAFVFNESLYDIKIFKGAKIRIVNDGSYSTINVKMKNMCHDGDYYIYTPHNDEKIFLSGKDEFSVTVPQKASDAFILRNGDETLKRVSTLKIKK